MAFASLFLPALLPAAIIVGVDFNHHVRDNIGSNTSQEPAYGTGATNRVGGAFGAAADRVLDNAVIGFNLPTFQSFAVIEGAEFSVPLTGKSNFITSDTSKKTDLYLFNTGVTPSSMDPADVLWNTDGEDTRGNVSLVLGSYLTFESDIGTRPIATLTAAQLESFYNSDGTPAQTTIWFRLNLDARETGLARYEIQASDAELSIIPEPRVYAALFGVFALGLVLLNRRLR